eukprot:gene18558-24926_t
MKMARDADAAACAQARLAIADIPAPPRPEQLGGRGAGGMPGPAGLGRGGGMPKYCNEAAEGPRGCAPERGKAREARGAGVGARVCTCAISAISALSADMVGTDPHASAASRHAVRRAATGL